MLEGATLELAARMVAQGSGGVVAGDLTATVARMRAVFERPYVGVDVAFQLTATDTGFLLMLSVPGRPRSARLLRHLALGSIRAAVGSPCCGLGCGFCLCHRFGWVVHDHLELAPEVLHAALHGCRLDGERDRRGGHDGESSDDFARVLSGGP